MAQGEDQKHTTEILTAMRSTVAGHRPDLVLKASFWICLEAWRDKKNQSNTGPASFLGWLEEGVAQVAERLDWHDTN